MELNELKSPIDPAEAVSTVSKKESSAWMIIAIACIFFTVGLFLYQINIADKDLKEEKREDNIECKQEIAHLLLQVDSVRGKLRGQIDSLRLINERLHDSVVYYREFTKWNMQKGQKEIIITPKQ